MVGIFSRFSGGRNGHRRSHSAVDVRQTLEQNAEIVDPARASAAHGIEAAIQFKPVEHPTEPMEYDQPVKCPLPEPSILNDGRIWKERLSSTAGARVRGDLPVVKEGSQLESEAAPSKPQPSPTKRAILPSYSAPEHNLIDLLEECSDTEDNNAGLRN